jgi:hypothetical protein
VSNAEERAWDVVRRAYAERPPARRRRGAPWLVPALVVVAAAVGAAVLSPPGRAVFERVRDAVGVDHADPALFSLPGPGRLLVVSEDGGGVWVVTHDGFKRKLGGYDDATWSPHALYVLASTRNRLVALDEDGHERWALARRGAASPSWAGSLTDTRIAYLARSGLRIVAGDGRGDRLADAAAAAVPPTWRPSTFDVTYVSRSNAVVVRPAGGGTERWRRLVEVRPFALEWSSDGRLLAVTSRTRVLVLDRTGRLVRTIGSLGATVAQSAFKPRSHRLAVVVRHPRRTELELVDVDRPGTARLLFAGPGVFGDVAWSPDGRALLVDWPTANQWLFLRGRAVHAVGNIRDEFPRHDDVVPHLRFAGRWR